MSTYQPTEIEKKWQNQWNEDGLYKAKPFDTKPKYYMLTMLPYPSGDLHIGHWYAMAPSDTIARFKRMQGHNVFFPIGFDAFGLPAENAAIKHNIHPKKWTYENMDRMRGQLGSMGAMFAWDQEIASCNPDYYKWNQWLFLKFFEQGLAYREYSPVDFCVHCNTTLAREQVTGDDRLCERCENPVIKKPLNQWKLGITQYAEDLLEFEGLEWPDRVKTMQTKWIGRSEGVEFELKVQGAEDKAFRVFTTRPDTVFGMSFCVLAPEHALVEQITSESQKEAVQEYKEQADRKTEIERTAEGKEKDGVFTGAYAINPMNQEPVPIWIADYVLASYGTGAIMAVPGHDQRDFEFARKYKLSVPVVVVENTDDQKEHSSDAWEEATVLKEDSKLVNSGEFDGLEWPASFDSIASRMTEKGIGERKINYRLRDWLISRQRMWGTPIPFVHCQACGVVPVPYEQLPVMLPDDAEYKPTGESPLKYHEGFLKTDCPKCGQPAERETDTMDTFFCSSWYHYAYVSPYWKSGQSLQKDDLPWDKELGDYWLNVDQYTGGIEHATMHLLYFRFFTKVMADIGLLPFKEPAKRLFNQGMILGEDHEKMSKSRGNVVNPDAIVQEYGADAVRAYLMFIGPWEAGAPWSSKGIEGIARFLKDVWTIAEPKGEASEENAQGGAELQKAMHQTLKKATDDYESFKFNTTIAALMAYRNTLKSANKKLHGSKIWKDAVDAMLLMLAPIAPHITEELWQKLHPGDSVHLQDWMKFDEALAKEDLATLVIQVNGKLRDRLEVEIGLDKAIVEQKALDSEKVQSFIEGKTVRKVIVVPNKLVNIVAN